MEHKRLDANPNEIKSTTSRTLRNPLDCSVLTHSDNRVYQVRATPSPKFLASLGALDIFKLKETENEASRAI